MRVCAGGNGGGYGAGRGAREIEGSNGDKRTAPSFPPVRSRRPATLKPMYCGSRIPEAPQQCSAAAPARVPEREKGCGCV